MTSTLGALSAFAASFTWALGTVFYSKLLQKYPSPLINSSRTLISFLIFAALATSIVGWNMHSGWEVLGAKNLYWSIASVVSSYALGDVVFFAASMRLGVPVALTIASTYPLWSAIAGYFLTAQPLALEKCLGMSLAIIGVGVVILGGGKNKSSNKDINGYLLALATSLFWALNSVAVSQASAGVNTLVAGTLRMGLAVLLCPLIGKFVLKIKSASVLVSDQDFAKYLWIFILEGFGGTFLFIYGFSHSSLATAATLSSLAPVLSVPLDYFFNNSKFNLVKILGIVLTSVGVILLVRGA